jgi:tetratricopeptide (TPR) repeat protein
MHALFLRGRVRLVLMVILATGFSAWGIDARAESPQTPLDSGVTPPSSAVPQPDAPKDTAKVVIPETIPDSAVERAKLLDNLYAVLATAEDEQAAEESAQGIMRLWHASGSDTVTLLMDRAAKSVGEKNPELALKLLDAVVELAPDYAEGWSQRAHVLYMENDIQRAVGDLRRALALDPNHFRALEALGHILQELGEKKGALQAYRRLLEVHPFAAGAKQTVEELEREVTGQGI